MSHILLPAVWLIVLIVGLPQLSETVYTPALPEIAYGLQTSESMIEFTLTIYLMGFALGTLFWGKLSDQWGRKPCVLGGLFIFIVGCLGCYCSHSIEFLMMSRLIQAFGGSIGSVLGQAICRDAFHGPSLGKVYSLMGSALAIFPALGPVLGGITAQHFGWYSIFLLLIAFGSTLSILVALKLPETHPKSSRSRVSLRRIAMKLIKDPKVLAFGLIVAACNGISFSYFAEGSFYLIELLGLSPSQYGMSFIGIALSSMTGGMISKRLHNHHTSEKIMGIGLWIIMGATLFFSGMAVVNPWLCLSKNAFIAITLGSQMLTMMGVSMATSNALALALTEYKWCSGTASSLFGFFYYTLISLFTLIMGKLHNGTLFPMPLYFLGLSLFMLGMKKMLTTLLKQ